MLKKHSIASSLELTSCQDFYDSLNLTRFEDTEKQCLRSIVLVLLLNIRHVKIFMTR